MLTSTHQRRISPVEGNCYLLESGRALAVESLSYGGRSCRFLPGRYDSCSFSNELRNSVFSNENWGGDS